MPDRLDELRKQRALVQQHLTWLDHEIAAVTVTRLTLPPFAMRAGTRAPIPGPAGAPSPAGTGVTRGPMTAANVPELSDFQVDPDNVQGDTRKGCIIYSAIAFFILVAILGVIYFVGYRDRPVLFVPDNKAAPAPTMVYPTGTPAPAKKAAPAPTNPPPK